jgi:hypothetical protein
MGGVILFLCITLSFDLELYLLLLPKRLRYDGESQFIRQANYSTLPIYEHVCMRKVLNRNVFHGHLLLFFYIPPI